MGFLLLSIMYAVMGVLVIAGLVYTIYQVNKWLERREELQGRRKWKKK